MVTLALEAGWRGLKLVEQKCEVTALETVLNLSKNALPNNNLGTWIVDTYFILLNYWMEQCRIFHIEYFVSLNNTLCTWSGPTLPGFALFSFYCFSIPERRDNYHHTRVDCREINPRQTLTSKSYLWEACVVFIIIYK